MAAKIAVMMTSPYKLEQIIRVLTDDVNKGVFPTERRRRAVKVATYSFRLTYSIWQCLLNVPTSVRLSLAMFLSA